MDENQGTAPETTPAETTTEGTANDTASEQTPAATAETPNGDGKDEDEEEGDSTESSSGPVDPVETFMQSIDAGLVSAREALAKLNARGDLDTPGTFIHDGLQHLVQVITAMEQALESYKAAK